MSFPKCESECRTRLFHISRGSFLILLSQLYSFLSPLHHENIILVFFLFRNIRFIQNVNKKTNSYQKKTLIEIEYKQWECEMISFWTESLVAKYQIISYMFKWISRNNLYNIVIYKSEKMKIKKRIKQKTKPPNGKARDAACFCCDFPFDLLNF